MKCFNMLYFTKYALFIMDSQFWIVVLFFANRYVGMPEMHIVTISNPSNKNQIRIWSIKTGSPHFHASPVKTNVSNLHRMLFNHYFWAHSISSNINIFYLFIYFIYNYSYTFTWVLNPGPGSGIANGLSSQLPGCLPRRGCP